VKTCTKCKVSKSLSAFHKDRTRKDGLKVWCIACSKAANQAAYQRRMEDPEKRAAHNARAVTWWKNNPDKRREAHLKSTYGITLEEYNTLLVQQNNVCAICREQPSTDAYLVVDHCHSTGKIRGLLCITCNLAIGYFKDEPKYLLSAVSYLESSSKS
jgi:hypothetical protein